MKTERMTILVTPKQKAAINTQAHNLGVSAGEMVRRAVETYHPSKNGVAGEEDILNKLADELFAAAKTARAALNAANKEVKIMITEKQMRPFKQMDDDKFTPTETLVFETSYNRLTP